MKIESPPLRWLLEGDPSVKYQTRKYLLGIPEDELMIARKMILSSGWGKKLMDLQSEKFTWETGIYSPKWTSTFYSLLLLKRFGSPPDDRIEKSLMNILDRGYYNDGGINFWKSWKTGEVCVTGMLLSVLSHFGIRDKRLHGMAKFLEVNQMNDKAWNCDIKKGATHSSFHTTISVLEGLSEYQKFFKDEVVVDTRELQKEGMEFLLQHKLFRSHRTGEIVDDKMLKFTFPPRWKYDIMRALWYASVNDLPRDKRFGDAVEIVKEKQNPDGTWNATTDHGGKIHFRMESPGKPGRWNTLRAMRILKWWEG